MHSYRFRAIKNYKDTFKLMRVTKMERFNSRFYFYYVNSRINPLTVTVDLSRLLLVVIEGQSYTELPKELWDKTKHIERRERAILSKSRQSDTFHTT